MSHNLNQNIDRSTRPQSFRRRRLAVALGLAFAVPLVVAPAESWAQSAGITELGPLNGGDYSQAFGVSADGSVVVGDANDGGSGGLPRAFRWTQSSGMQSLGVLNGGAQSSALGISADGAVVVGYAGDGAAANAQRAFRWTQSGGMLSLGTLNGGTHSSAHGISADGAVVVGSSADGSAGNALRAFRWTQAGGMLSLGVLNGGNSSWASAASADGSVVVGYAADGAAGGSDRAFRWTQAGGLVSLGIFDGGNWSEATGVSADGSVVVGRAGTVVGDHAFRWTQAGGLMDLGVLAGGIWSAAYGVSANGAVVVGSSDGVEGGGDRAFRWTQETGMQSVEDWLRAAGVAVAQDVTWTANATNSDGSVVVGMLSDGYAFVARVSALGSGLASLSDLQASLRSTAAGARMALTSADLLINGAHSRPLSRRVAAGQNTVWVAGDWGRDDHGERDGDLGLAEVGLGRNFGPVQLNVSLGQTWASQNLVFNGQAKVDGTHLLAEALIPVSDTLWVVLGGYGHWGEADLKRGYRNAGAQDYSTGSPDVDTWGLRARLELDKAYRLAGADFSPYVDLHYREAKLDAYTEHGGGFPAHFAARKDQATELRLGANAERPVTANIRIVGTLEAAHRFEEDGPRTSGQVLGLFGFDFAGADNKQDWLRAGAGVEGSLAGGTGSLMLNATTQGEVPSYWLAAGWRKAF